ncbi:metal-dependent hydrolase [Methanocella conradii]|uniref:metal-dependent hydrolase n=1 Tax=Methanocella conradii TaxID=1175444 RepID=UPI00157C0F42|nr:metal-dependent hydrolase [Methanocella conradii]
MLVFGHLGITLLFVFIVFSPLKEKLDYRFVLAGALLPDLIDKPVGDYIFYSVFQNGRIFGHTMLFALALAGMGMYLNKRRGIGAVEALALGSLLHIAEDQMWLAPGTLFWPLLGWEFPKYDIENYAGYIIYVLFHEPSAYVPEMAGIIILVAFILYFKLYRPERIRLFISRGSL